MPIWDKGYNVNDLVINFTVGNDNIIDRKIALQDCIASKAHAKMLAKIGILKNDEADKLCEGLSELIDLIDLGQFKINKSEEDCHTVIENFLVDKYGEVGKKIHTGRSRNDQVLVALRLYEKQSLKDIANSILDLSKTIDNHIKQNGDVNMPGYTHMRKAMPSSINMWLGSFKESLSDDYKCINHVAELVDQNPLGSAAGFGVPEINIDREFTTKELGFKKVQSNPMYAQISRGKFEGNIINACSQLMLTLNKLASDLILFSMSEFNFISLPKEMCTGSSIMPQKQNPDVLELVRAKYHEIIAEEIKVKSMIANLMSGYNRDVQLTKESVIKSLEITHDATKIMTFLLENIKINADVLQNAMTSELYATEKANKLVNEGKSFREAYQIVGREFLS